ncbi:response regulator transcription factor [Flavobacterium sp. PLA-1-15]|uniref:response regulator transcription factor n=1 Tax=Flavobacterium sp. PLA-1-15 TaxID=3380533 RepID=UPI003B78DFC9
MSDQKKILIVEDDDLMIKILQFVLKKEGYQLTIAKDGLNAIERIPTIEPDMVLTDVMLPYKSGLEVINFIKDKYPTMPVIVLSALGEEERTVVEAFKLGADDFVAKPFNPNELVLRVKRLLNK